MREKRAGEGGEGGKLGEEIVAVTWKGKKGKEDTVEGDEGVGGDRRVEEVGGVKGIFRGEGRVTGGKGGGVNEGAGGFVVM